MSYTIEQFVDTLKAESRKVASVTRAVKGLVKQRNTTARMILDMAKEGVIPAHSVLKQAYMDTGSNERSAASTASNMVKAFEKAAKYPVEAADLVIEKEKGWRELAKLKDVETPEQKYRGQIAELVRKLNKDNLKQAATMLALLVKDQDAAPKAKDAANKAPSPVTRVSEAA